MGCGEALWNERGFSEVFVGAWGYVEGTEGGSRGENEDRCAGGMETNQKVIGFRIG